VYLLSGRPLRGKGRGGGAVAVALSPPDLLRLQARDADPSTKRKRLKKEKKIPFFVYMGLTVLLLRHRLSVFPDPRETRRLVYSNAPTPSVREVLFLD
jgi:hypothetical protein